MFLFAPEVMKVCLNGKMQATNDLVVEGIAFCQSICHAVW